MGERFHITQIIWGWCGFIDYSDGCEEEVNAWTRDGCAKKVRQAIEQHREIHPAPKEEEA